MTLEFIGRTEELAILEREYQKESSFVLLTGRRRIGKTRLIKEFVKNKKAFVFQAPNQTRAAILNRLTKGMKEYFGTPLGTFSDWYDLFRSIPFKTDEKLIVVIDEFQYLVKSDEDFLGGFQLIWDEVLSSANIMLIICGSHISMMESLAKDYDGPLYGRFTRHLVLSPLPFETVRNGRDYTKELEKYAILGGIPKYMELFDDVDLRENVIHNIMSDSAIMYEDPLTILRDEVKEVAGYMSIMESIAHGNRRLNKIASSIEVQSTVLPPYLKRLSEMHMVKRDVPITEDNPSKSKLGLYQISDNFTEFWFKFIYPYQSSLSYGDMSLALNNFDKHFIEDHVSFVFEEECRSRTREISRLINIPFNTIGKFWNRNTELDVVAINNEDKIAFVAECKYRKNRKMDRHVLNELKKDVESVHELKGFRIILGLFSVSGFEDELYHSDAILIDKGEVVHNPINGMKTV